MHGGYEFVQLGDILTTRLLFECWSLGAKEYIARTFDLCCLLFFYVIQLATYCCVEWACDVLSGSLTALLTFSINYLLTFLPENNIDFICSSL